MITTSKERIRIYYNVRQSLDLAKKIYEKHKADGEGSILSSIDGFSWEATGPKIGFCLEKHKEAVRLSRCADEVYRQRDAVLSEITDIMKASKSILKSKFIVSPEKLNDWGFVVFENNEMLENLPP